MPFGFGGDFDQPSLKREEKRMRKALCVSALFLALTCSAYAGEIQNGVTGTLPTAPQEQTADGWIPNDITDTVLSVLGSVLALL